jgi:hypothetical protein
MNNLMCSTAAVVRKGSGLLVQGFVAPKVKQVEMLLLCHMAPGMDCDARPWLVHNVVRKPGVAAADLRL